MRDVLSQHERRRQVIDIARFASVWSERDYIHTSRLSQLIQSIQISINIISVIRIRRIMIHVPMFWHSHMFIRSSLWFRLIVYHVKPYDSFQEMMQLRMRRRINRHFKQRHENVIKHLLEVFHRSLRFVNVIQPRQLNHPYNVLRE